ncbi:MAG: hypothetical protein LBI38_07755 [Oscillospiraceae bacterium]|jgi:hypothetical protein|nr:hypothetical protein [Oscillospiraceae bacterium]
MKKYTCPICGYAHSGNKAPVFCPHCKCRGEKFDVSEEKETIEELLFGFSETAEEPEEETPPPVAPGVLEDDSALSSPEDSEPPETKETPKPPLSMPETGFSAECAEAGFLLSMSLAAENAGCYDFAEALRRAALGKAKKAAENVSALLGL